MATDDFFRARLDSMIDMRHPLVVLATRMPWTEIEASLAPALAHKDRSGRLVQDADLFGPTAQFAGAGLSNAGRPRLHMRLMVALLYLKQARERIARIRQSLVEIDYLCSGTLLQRTKVCGKPGCRCAQDQLG
jgi:IS5 family transposase